MKHLFRTLILVATIAVAASFSADAKKKNVDLVEKYPALAPYFSTPTEEAIQPDDRGFIRRWLLLEPISKPNRTNTVFVDSYVRQNLDTGWNQGDFKVPADGDKVTMEEILENVISRDKADMERAISPLRQAEDAVVLDNSYMSVEEQMAWFMERYEKIVNA